MKVPADVYRHSSRPYRGLEELAYPLHDWTATITRCGRICWHRHKINVSVVFAGQNVGVRQVSDRIWLVSLWTTISATSTTKPVGWNRSRIRSQRKCYLSPRNKLLPIRPEQTLKKFGAPGRSRTCDPRLKRPVLYPLSYGRVARMIAHRAVQFSSPAP